MRENQEKSVVIFRLLRERRVYVKRNHESTHEVLVMREAVQSTGEGDS